MKILSTVIIVMMLNSLAYCQVKLGQKYSFKVDKKEYSNVVVLSNGNILIHSAIKRTGECKYIVLNNKQEILNEHTIRLKGDFYRFDFISVGNLLYSLHEKAIIIYNTKTFEHELVKHNLQTAYYGISDFSVSGNYAYIIAKDRRRKAVNMSAKVKRQLADLIRIDLSTGETVTITPKIEGVMAASLYQLVSIAGTDDVIAVYTTNIKKKQWDYYGTPITKDGQLGAHINLTEGNVSMLQGIKVVKIGPNKYCYLSAYARESRSQSDGILACIVENNKQTKSTYYNWYEFKNFISGFIDRNRKKILKYKLKADKKGEKLLLGEISKAHEAVLTNSGIYYFFETGTNYLNGSTVVNFMSVSHAMVLKFDLEGNLLWDQAISMTDATATYYQTIPIISFQVNDQGEVNTLYNSKTRLFYKSISVSGSIEKERQLELHLGKSRDIQRNVKDNMVSVFCTPVGDKQFVIHGKLDGRYEVTGVILK